MSEADKMLLRDAMETAIEAHSVIIKQKRTIIILSVVSVILAIANVIQYVR